TGQRIREALQFGDSVWRLAFSPNGTQLAAGSNQGKVRVFDVATGKTVLGPIKAHTERVTSALFTLDGKQFITASLDKSIRVWDGSTGQEVGDPMQGHEHIQQIALSYDGRRLASVAYDGTVRVWDQNTRPQLGDSLRAQDNVQSLAVAWSPSGRSIVAGTKVGSIYLWDVPPLEAEDSDTTAVGNMLSSLLQASLKEAQPPVFAAGNPLQPSASQLRTSSLSPSILDLPVGAPTPVKPNSNPPPLPADFWDFPDSDPPALVRPPISVSFNGFIIEISVELIHVGPGWQTVSRDEQPSTKPSAPASSKTTPKTPVSASPAKPPINLSARILARFRRDKHAADNIEMEPPRASHLPKYSRVVKVPLAEADVVSNIFP
ncbi:quinon protein alcohol dehydrogenase-like superfamily, partial [Hygrophoropsis aurantiaca]